METLPVPSSEEGQNESPEPKRDGRMTFTEHLGELRTRIVRSAGAVLVAMVVCYIFSNQLIEILARPLATFNDQETIEIGDGSESDGEEGAIGEEEEADRPIEWTVLNPLEPVLVKLKIAAYGGLFVSMPFIIFQICAFIFPGLTGSERKVVRICIFGCSILAVGGVSVAYWAVFPLVLPYLVTFAPSFVNVQLRMNETLSLLLKGFAGFAIAFQFPMVVLVLVYMDLLTPAKLKEYRKFAIIIMCVAGMMLTPPDPFSMLMMAMPMVLLYEMSIWASYLVVRRKKKKAAA